jgi:plasmid stabilization system protein ParE
MAAGFRQSSHNLVIYSPLAALDLAENHTHTAHHWGYDQAERYTELLKATAQHAADQPDMGSPIEDHPGIRALLVRWKQARHGHYVVYRPVEDGAYVLRFLHSAMDLPDHIDL